MRFFSAPDMVVMIILALTTASAAIAGPVLSAPLRSVLPLVTAMQPRDGDHAGPVGRNGAGKTTSCKLLLGIEDPDEGRIEQMRGLRIGLLEQQVHAEGSGTVRESALEVFADPDVMLVHTWEGRPISREHGGPLRVLIPRWYLW